MALYAKYTFFDLACDNGVIVTALRDIIPKHHEIKVEAVRNSHLRVVSLFKNGESSPYWVYEVHPRSIHTPHGDYHTVLREDIVRKWKAHKAQADCGQQQSDEPPSRASPPIASSIIPTTEPELSLGKSKLPENPSLEVAEQPDSGLLPQTRISGKFTGNSTRPSKLQSKRKAS